MITYFLGLLLNIINSNAIDGRPTFNVPSLEPEDSVDRLHDCAVRDGDEDGDDDVVPNQKARHDLLILGFSPHLSDRSV